MTERCRRWLHRAWHRFHDEWIWGDSYYWNHDRRCYMGPSDGPIEP